MIRAIRCHCNRFVIGLALLRLSHPAVGQEPRESDPPNDVDALRIAIQEFRYVAGHRVPLDVGRQTYSWAIGEFTVRGPVVETLRPAHVRPPVTGRVGDASYFDSGARFDAQTGRRTSLEDETVGRLPDAGRHGVMAFDSIRGQLVAYRDGSLYTYDPVERRWTSRKESKLGEIGALVYAPGDDVLYAVGKVETPPGKPPGGENLALHKITMDGVLVATAPFDEAVMGRLGRANLRGRGRGREIDLAYHLGHLIMHIGDERLVARVPECTVVYYAKAEPAAIAHPLAKVEDDHGDGQMKSSSEVLSTAFEHLQEKLTAAGRQDGSDRAARALDRLSKIKTELEVGDYPEDSAAELHGISVYSVPENRIDVEVTHVARPVTLLLSAYESTRWHVNVAQGASLAGIFLSGYHAHHVEGVGDDVPVTDLTQDATARELFLNDPREAVRLFLGRELTSLQAPGNDTQAFVVGPKSVDWKTEYALGQVRALEDEWLLDEIGGAEFLALDRTPQGGKPRSRLSTFTLAGPVPGSGVTLAEPLVQVVRDPATGDVYGISDSDVFQVDPRTGGTTSLTEMADLPNLGRVTAIAFDPETRVLLVHSTQEFRRANGVNIDGHLWLEFDVETKKWQTLAYPATDIGGITYLPATKTLYGLDLGYHRSQLSLATLNRHAARLNVTWLSDRFHWHPWDGAPQLIAVKDYLVAIVPPRHWMPRPMRSRSDIYVIDPQDGHTAYAGSFGE